MTGISLCSLPIGGTPFEDWGLPSWSTPKTDLNVDSFFEQAEHIKTQTQQEDIIIEVVVPYEEEDLIPEVESRVREALEIYPNISVRR